MSVEPDLFILFRGTLFLFLAIYFGLSAWSAVWRLRRLLAGARRGKRLLRVYLGYQLATVRLRPLAGELAQLGLWLAGLVVIWWAHRRV